ncbi:MAG: hypothetical protein RIQ78_616, partial [Bacteroidota bacterium]
KMAVMVRCNIVRGFHAKGCRFLGAKTQMRRDAKMGTQREGVLAETQIKGFLAETQRRRERGARRDAERGVEV